MIRLETKDGFPIPYFIRKLNFLIGDDNFNLVTYYKINMSDGRTYYTLQNYQPNTSITVFSKLDFKNPITATCTGSYSVLIGTTYGTFDSKPLIMGSDLLATEKSIVNYVNDELESLLITDAETNEILKILE